eukprot:GHVR01151057.1.p1 GENE.GHVR01151057.1~~GHVR01151057.1.p1  ORF type:complete len:387 (-),score=127.36 GHVR01151057.1:212-1348(-)
MTYSNKYINTHTHTHTHTHTNQIRNNNINESTNSLLTNLQFLFQGGGSSGGSSGGGDDSLSIWCTEGHLVSTHLLKYETDNNYYNRYNSGIFKKTRYISDIYIINKLCIWIIIPLILLLFSYIIADKILTNTLPNKLIRQAWDTYKQTARSSGKGKAAFAVVDFTSKIIFFFEYSFIKFINFCMYFWCNIYIPLWNKIILLPTTYIENKFYSQSLTILIYIIVIFLIFNFFLRPIFIFVFSKNKNKKERPPLVVIASCTVDSSAAHCAKVASALSTRREWSIGHVSSVKLGGETDTTRTLLELAVRDFELIDHVRGTRDSYLSLRSKRNLRKVTRTLRQVVVKDSNGIYFIINVPMAPSYTHTHRYKHTHTHTHTNYR